MPEREKRKAQIARLLATVSVLGISVGMFRPAVAADLTPSQQDKWSPTAESGATQQDKYAPLPSDVASPKLDAGSKDPALQSGGGGATITHSGGATEQMNLDTFTGGVHPEDQLGNGSGSGAGKAVMTPGGADYDKNKDLNQTGGAGGGPQFDSKQGKLELPAVQNKLNQPDALYMKQTMPDVTVPGVGPAQPK